MPTSDQTPVTLAEVVRVVRRYAVGATIAFFLLVAASVYSANEAGNSAADARTAAKTAAKVSADSRVALVASGKVALVTGCNRDFHTQGAFVDLLQRLDKATEANYRAGKSTKEARDAARAFYQPEIRKAMRLVPDCRVVENVLTADPNVPIPVIKPLYPKKP